LRASKKPTAGTAAAAPSNKAIRFCKCR
jgi:hypothetical protein